MDGPGWRGSKGGEVWHWSVADPSCHADARMCGQAQPGQPLPPPQTHLKRLQYCFGDMMVGSLPLPPRMPLLFTHVSSCLSHVYCLQRAGGKSCEKTPGHRHPAAAPQPRSHGQALPPRRGAGATPVTEARPARGCRRRRPITAAAGRLCRAGGRRSSLNATCQPPHCPSPPPSSLLNPDP
jgi:hypothetical protein